MGEVGTYDTRPMSEGWSKPRDVGPLADSHAELTFAIPLAEFPRLAPQLGGTAGEARGSVRFARDRGVPVADLEVSAELDLTCQRCLGPMRLPVANEVRVALLSDPSQADSAPQDVETMLAEGGRVTLRDLVEEELLLEVPLVPRHATAAECGPGQGGRRRGPEPPAEEMQKPFERLGELLKRKE